MFRDCAVHRQVSGAKMIWSPWHDAARLGQSEHLVAELSELSLRDTLSMHSKHDARPVLSRLKISPRLHFRKDMPITVESSVFLYCDPMSWVS